MLESEVLLTQKFVITVRKSRLLIRLFEMLLPSEFCKCGDQVHYCYEFFQNGVGIELFTCSHIKWRTARIVLILLE